MEDVDADDEGDGTEMQPTKVKVDKLQPADAKLNANTRSNDAKEQGATLGVRSWICLLGMVVLGIVILSTRRPANGASSSAVAPALSSHIPHPSSPAVSGAVSTAPAPSPPPPFALPHLPDVPMGSPSPLQSPPFLLPSYAPPPPQPPMPEPSTPAVSVPCPPPSPPAWPAYSPPVFAWASWDNSEMDGYEWSGQHWPDRGRWDQGTVHVGNQYKVVYQRPLNHLSTDLQSGRVPRRIFTFWNDPNSVPESVAAAILRIGQINPSWEVYLLHYHIEGIPWPDECSQCLSNTHIPEYYKYWAHISDWYRLNALKLFGGVWIDSACIINRRLEDFIHMDVDRVQGWNYKGSLESWFIVAPFDNQLLRDWLQEFDNCWHGPNTYRAWAQEANAICCNMLSEMPYLSIHGAFQVAANPDLLPPSQPLTFTPKTQPIASTQPTSDSIHGRRSGRLRAAISRERGAVRHRRPPSRALQRRL